MQDDILRLKAEEQPCCFDWDAIRKSEAEVFKISVILHPKLHFQKVVLMTLSARTRTKLRLFIFFIFYFSLGIILNSHAVRFCACSECSGGLQRGGGAGDADGALRPGPPAGAGWDIRGHHDLHLQPDAVAARQHFRAHAGLWESAEGHRSE